MHRARMPAGPGRERERERAEVQRPGAESDEATSVTRAGRLARARASQLWTRVTRGGRWVSQSATPAPKRQPGLGARSGMQARELVAPRRPLCIPCLGFGYMRRRPRISHPLAAGGRDETKGRKLPPRSSPRSHPNPDGPRPGHPGTHHASCAAVRAPGQGTGARPRGGGAGRWRSIAARGRGGFVVREGAHKLLERPPGRGAATTRPEPAFTPASLRQGLD